MQMKWFVSDVVLPPAGASFLGSPAGVVVRMRLRVAEIKRFCARVGQLTTGDPPFTGRLEVDGLLQNATGAEVARSMSASATSEGASSRD